MAISSHALRVIRSIPVRMCWEEVDGDSTPNQCSEEHGLIANNSKRNICIPELLSAFWMLGDLQRYV